MTDLDIPPEVITAYDLGDAAFAPISSGWINRTYRVERGDERFILQRLHPVFSGEVNLDIDAITSHLAAHGIPTPRIVRTIDGARWIDVERPWRMLTFLEGQTVESLDTPERARSAGAIVARFHAALADLDHEFAFTRPGAHDTPAHLAKLRRLRASPPAGLEPEERATIDALADSILEHALPEIPTLPTRIIHGDLKATNLLFDGDVALALVDLDTLAHGTLAMELGDALRSWCNRTDESDVDATFDAATFEAAMRGYGESARDFLTDTEASAIVPGAETIALELASRFAADVYEDSYFGYDASRFPTRRAHNLARTRAQLSLARSIASQREPLRRLARALLERRAG